MTLIFQTPSKRCPSRCYNGQEVKITEHRGHHRLNRSGWVPQFYVELVNRAPREGRFTWLAFGDELFVDPPTQAEPRGSLVGTLDEYGTVWDGEPGASDVIGDLVSNDADETMAVYIQKGAA